MKERPVNREGAVVAYDQASEVPQPRVGALDDPAPFVPPKRAAILRCRSNAISLVRADPFDPALPQPRSQWSAVVCFVSAYPHRLLPWPAGVMTSPYPDGRQDPASHALHFIRICPVCHRDLLSRKVCNRFETSSAAEVGGWHDVRRNVQEDWITKLASIENGAENPCNRS